MTGLIYVAIVGLWAAVLIPMWLNRHDADEAHRRSQHETALGVLARFRSPGSAAVTSGQRAVRRRRRIGVALLALSAAGATAWAMGMAGLWVVLAPLALLGIFVTIAAVMGQTRRQQLAGRERARKQRTIERNRPVQAPAVPPRTAAPRPQRAQRPRGTRAAPTGRSLEDLFDQTA